MLKIKELLEEKLSSGKFVKGFRVNLYGVIVYKGFVKGKTFFGPGFF